MTTSGRPLTKPREAGSIRSKCLTFQLVLVHGRFILRIRHQVWRPIEEWHPRPDALFQHLSVNLRIFVQNFHQAEIPQHAGPPFDALMKILAGLMSLWTTWGLCSAR